MWMYLPVVLLLLLLLSWWFQSGTHKTDSEGFGFRLRASKTNSCWNWASKTGPLGHRVRQVQHVTTSGRPAGSRHIMNQSTDPLKPGREDVFTHLSASFSSNCSHIMWQSTAYIKARCYWFASCFWLKKNIPKPQITFQSKPIYTFNSIQRMF